MSSAQQMEILLSQARITARAWGRDYENKVQVSMRWLTREWFKANKLEAQSKRANQLLNTSEDL